MCRTGPIPNTSPQIGPRRVDHLFSFLRQRKVDDPGTGDDDVRLGF
jgi:hypothetical protein